MRLGCHVSIAGGIEQSISRAKALEINTMQIFSKNSRTWQEKIYTNSEIIEFQRKLQKSNLSPIFIHASYLINLASPDEEIYTKSIAAFREELKRGGDLLVNLSQPYLIIHPGAHRGAGEEFGLNRIIEALRNVLKQSSYLKLSTMVLLENTSGMGSGLGHSFSQLKYIMEQIDYPDKVGVCFDTCHAFAAGYNLAEEQGIEETIAQFDREIGLDKLKAIHLNDSKYGLGSKRDRHTHIGEGFIGTNGFRLLINHPQLKDLPFILETPKKNDKDDRRNIELVRSLRE